MKALLTLLALVFAIGTASSQQPATPVRNPFVPPPLPSAPVPAPARPEDGDLTRNYRLTLTFKDGDGAAKDLAALTASPQLHSSASFGQEENGTGMMSLLISGVLTEKGDGQLRLTYELNATLPAFSRPLTPQPATTTPPPPRAPYLSQLVSNDTTTGVLLMELGKSYEVFKSGTRTYTITVSPENADKKK